MGDFYGKLILTYLMVVALLFSVKFSYSTLKLFGCDKEECLLPSDLNKSWSLISIFFKFYIKLILGTIPKADFVCTIDPTLLSVEVYYSGLMKLNLLLLVV